MNTDEYLSLTRSVYYRKKSLHHMQVRCAGQGNVIGIDIMICSLAVKLTPQPPDNGSLEDLLRFPFLSLISLTSAG